MRCMGSFKRYGLLLNWIGVPMIDDKMYVKEALNLTECISFEFQFSWLIDTTQREISP